MRHRLAVLPPHLGRSILAAALAALGGCTPGDPPAPSPIVDSPTLRELGWLTGEWRRSEGADEQEEVWSAPAGGTLVGSSRTVRNGVTVAVEGIRIEATGDGIDYVAWPRGQQETRFRLVESGPAPGPRRAVFENPTHDFPQRIVYARDGDRLTARIEGGGESMEWTWSLAPARPRADLAGAEREVRELLARQAAAWSAGELEAFCAPYAEDALFLSPSGITRGRDAILARYDKRYRQDGQAMGELGLEVLEIRMTPSGDGAAVGLRWRLSWETKEPAEGLSLVVLRRSGDGWSVVQDASL